MKTIFIAYNHKDAVVTRFIYKRLVAEDWPEVEIFMDEFSIMPSEDIRERCLLKARTADLGIVVLSEYTQQSEYVPQEVGILLNRDIVKIYVSIHEDYRVPPGYERTVKSFPLYEGNPSEQLDRLAELISHIIQLREAKSTVEQYEEIPEEEVVKKCYKLYQAEELFHQFGYETEDGDASNRKAWCADLGERRWHIIFGPYEPLGQAGEYIALFKIKIDDNSLPNPMLLLDVSGGTTMLVWGGRSIRGTDFNAPMRYRLFGLKFKCQGTEATEYRALNFVQRGNIWIDYVAVIKL